MRFGQFAGDGEAEAGAAGAGRAFEGDEEVVAGARRQAGAVVGDAEASGVSPSSA